MNRLLVIQSSPRGEQSISRNMTRSFVSRWQSAHQGGEVVDRDLAKIDLPFVTAPWLQAYFTPPAQQSPEMKADLGLSDELVRELVAADHVVIATPVYNYNVPAVLKAWVDQIVRKGITLGFDGKGLLENKKATILIASGATYTEGSPIRDRDIATQYLRLILSVIGITEVTVIAGGGAKAVDLRDATMEGFVAKLQPEIDRAAAAE